MIDNFDTLLVQVITPIYAFPVVAVIICVVIVYAFGFKSPVQPPSFEGIEEEKKYTKKRKAKDNTKSKVIQNGKVNGTVTNKTQVSSKKKDSTEKPGNEKPVTSEIVASEKKSGKKSKHEKKPVVEKKKDNISHDEMNDDGWVQLISKKGRKNRKKDDVSVNEKKHSASKVKNVIDEIQAGERPQTESKKVSDDFIRDDTVSLPTQDSSKPDTDHLNNIENVSNHGKSKDEILVEVPKSDSGSAKQQQQSIKTKRPKDGKLEEGGNKSKKKKKKGSENESSNNSESPAVQVLTDVSASQEKQASSVTVVTSESSEISGNPKTERVAEPEPKSNVAFDELQGLYPVPKEQKKKKKVRRDH